MFCFFRGWWDRNEMHFFVQIFIKLVDNENIQDFCRFFLFKLYWLIPLQIENKRQFGKIKRIKKKFEPPPFSIEKATNNVVIPM